MCKWLGILTVKDLLETFQYVGVFAASIAAVRGFDQWRKELIGRRRLELAEEVIDIFSRMPSVFAKIRSPFSTTGECEELEKLVKSGTQRHDGLMTLLRIDSYKEFFSRIDAVRYKFLAYFGEENDEAFMLGKSALDDISTAAFILGSAPSITQRQDCQTKIWFSPTNTGNDAINNKIERAKDKILKLCQPLLASTGKK